jgi:nitrite reductase/ring-hydroxylating ferredoxin subunit
MKKVTLIAMTILFSCMTVFAANLYPYKALTDTTKTKKMKTAEVLYTCPMHHDMISHKPGKCTKPNCGMTLVEKTDTKKTYKIKM